VWYRTVSKAAHGRFLVLIWCAGKRVSCDSFELGIAVPQMATIAVDQQWPIELVHRTGVRREAKKNRRGAIRVSTTSAYTLLGSPPLRITLYLVFRVTIDT
jgi:hypothetical protein